MTHASLQAGQASLLYLILHLEQECNRLNSCYILQKHISPAKEGCTSFEGNPAFLRKLWYFGRDSGKVHASISLVLRCKYIYIYFIIFIPELCVYLKWSFTFWLWCIYYIAFNKGNTSHKVILKQKLWLCIGIAWN